MNKYNKEIMKHVKACKKIILKKNAALFKKLKVKENQIVPVNLVIQNEFDESVIASIHMFFSYKEIKLKKGLEK